MSTTTPDSKVDQVLDPATLIAIQSRLISGAVLPYPKTFALGLVSGAGSLFASISNEQAIGFGMALVAFGTVVAQPCLKMYDAYRARKQAADAMDRKTVTDEYLIQVHAKDEWEREAARLKDQNQSQQAQIDNLKKEIAGLRKGAGRAIEQVAKQADANSARITAVETQQGSMSGIDITVNTQAADPK